MPPDLKKIKKNTILLYLSGTILSVPLFLGFYPPQIIPFLWLKVLHITGVIMFMGNIIIGPLWITYALRSGNSDVIFFAMKSICWADIIFSIPGIFLVLISGLMLSQTLGGYNSQGWIMASLLLLALSLIPAIPTLRSQYKLYQLSHESVLMNKSVTVEFSKEMKRWSVWGTVATVLPIISFVLMIIKPI